MTNFFPNSERGTAIEVLYETLLTVLDHADPMMPFDEACTAVACGPMKMKEMLAAGQLPGLKIGKEWRIPRRAFIDRLNEMAVSGMLERLKKEHAMPLPNPPVGQRTRGRPRISQLTD